MAVKPYYQDDAVTIYHGDCREIAPSVSADVVISDPPYGIGMNSFSDELYVSVDGINCSPGNIAILFMSPRSVFKFVQMLSWNPERLLWWNKKADIAYPWRGWYMNSEAICVLSRAGAEWPKSGVRFHSDLYSSGPLNTKPTHPAWKPVGVIADLMQHTAGIVIDPFCGSGPTLEAARLSGRKAIGIEIEERYCEIAAKRMAQEVLDF